MVAHATARWGAVLGLAITASHNPMPDNGLKLFTDGGHKLSDAQENALEASLDQPWERHIGGAGQQAGRNLNGERRCHDDRDACGSKMVATKKDSKTIYCD